MKIHDLVKRLVHSGNPVSERDEHGRDGGENEGEKEHQGGKDTSWSLGRGPGRQVLKKHPSSHCSNTSYDRGLTAARKQ